MNINEKWQMPLVLSLALLVRIAWWVANASVIENEGAEYARLATNLLHGIGYVGILGGEHVLFPPLYPALIALVTILVGDPEVAGRLVSLVSGIVLVFAIHRITREVFGPTVALIAAAISALHPLLVALSVAVYSESLTLALVCMALYATILTIRRPSFRQSIVTGLLFGAAYLVRPEGLVFAAVAAFLVTIAGIAQRRGVLLTVRCGAVLFLSSVLLAAPYIAFLSVKSGAFHWEGKSLAIALLNERIRSGMSFAEAARGLGPNMEPAGPFLVANQFELLSRSQSRPVDSLRTIVSSPIPRIQALIYDMITSRFLGCPLAGMLAIVGFLAMRWWKTSLFEGLALLAFLGIQLLALLSLEFRFQRYLFPILPLFLPWTAAGVERLGYAASRLTQKLVRAPYATTLASSLMYIGLIVAVLIVAYPATMNVGELSQARERHLKQAGVWIKADFGRDQPRVATYSSVIPYYANGILHYLPFAPEPLALRYLHKIRPDFIVVRSDDVRQAPYIVDWLNRGIPDRCAVPGTTVVGGEGAVVKIWHWKCSD